MNGKKVLLLAVLLIFALTLTVSAQKKTDVTVFGWLTTYAKPFS